jgi:hypothetical protein
MPTTHLRLRPRMRVNQRGRILAAALRHTPRDSLACVSHWYALPLIITATPVGSSLLSGNPVTDVVRAADNVHAFQLARSQETHHIEVNDRYFLQVQDTVGRFVSELVRQFREVL